MHMIQPDLMPNWIVRADRLSKTFQTNSIQVKALRGVSLEIFPGEIVLVTGPSGSGKTTLLSLQGLLLHPTEGTVSFQNHAISSTSPMEEMTDLRRSHIGFIFQSFNLVHCLTVLENVEFFLHLQGLNGKSAKKQALEALSLVQMHHRLNFHPHHLSGGEKQRVGIARAIAGNPCLILADEPTANLDGENGRIVADYFRQIAKTRDTTIVIASHDQRLESYADRILRLEDGQFA